MTESNQKTSVLFVCMGNICRSPTAEGVFRRLVAEAGLDELFEIDSAGTHAYQGFERVLDLVEDASRGLLDLLRQR